MRRILLILLLCLPGAYAELSDTDQKIDEASAIISDFFSEFNNNEMVIIQGSKISLEEKMIFGLIKQRNAQLQGIDIKPDTFSDTRLAYILVGQKTNLYAKDLKIKESTTEDFSPVLLTYGTLETGEKFLIAYSEKEVINKQNQAILKSPLANIVEPAYIPLIIFYRKYQCYLIHFDVKDRVICKYFYSGFHALSIIASSSCPCSLRPSRDCSNPM